MSRTNPTTVYRNITVIAVLLGLNLAIFHDHYAGSDQFPWDFWKTYYAVVAFWTNLARHGVISEWVPFQYMGYPFFLNPQTGFFYPPLWFFVASGIHYSLRVAAIVQGLHVLWGAAGAFFLIRILTLDWRVALFGAVAYHFFGGFYSNAEHIDIVRAYAWLPWLFWAATIRGNLTTRNFLLPIVLFCALAGSYPGNIGSHTLFLGLYLLIERFCRRGSFLALKPTIFIFVLLGLGLLLSAPVILPSLMLRGYLHHTTAGLPSGNWSFHNWLSLLTPWTVGKAAITGFTGDPSMISAFVGIPVVALVTLTNKKTVQQYLAWWVLLLFALLLALGQSSFFYNALVRVLPMLGLSRFPSSDYRGVVALSLIVLAAASLQALWTRSDALRAGDFRVRAAWSLFIPIIILAGIFEVALPVKELIWICVIWLLFLLSIYICLKTPSQHPNCLFVVALLFTCLQGGHVLSVSKWTWTADGEDLEKAYVKNLGFSTSSSKARAPSQLRNPTTRTARTTRARNDFAWAGYLNASYQTGDYGNTELEAQYRASHDPILFRYMKLPLTPIVFPGAQEVSREMLMERLTDGVEESFAGNNKVIPTLYGLSSLHYDVTLGEPATVVLNEIWFPGWSGEVVDTDGHRIAQLSVQDVDKTLRAWRLPSGSYKLITRFHTPYLRCAISVAIIALILYLGIVLVTFRLGYFARALRG